MKLPLPLLTLVLLARTPVFGQTFQARFQFGGADVGSSRHEARPDGWFESVSELNLGPVRIASRLTGRFANGLLTEYTLVQSQGGQEMRIAASGDKAEITAGGGTRITPFKPAARVFANFHPALSGTVVRDLDSGEADSARVEVLILDGPVAMPVDVVRRQPRVVEAGGRRVAARFHVVRFPTGVDIEVFTDEAGGTLAWNVPSQTIKAVAAGFEALVLDPTARFPELSQPTHSTRRMAAVKIPVRDGVELVADVALPEGAGPFPVILTRTPYGRQAQMAAGENWARRGYAFVAQDCRGRGDSGGDWEPFMNERRDGYDTLDWVSKQAWCNGSIGMIGASYGGWAQWWAAVEGHPALKCIVPQVSPPDPFFNIPWDHGIPFLYGAIWWASVVKDKAPLTGVSPFMKDVEALKTLPLSQVEDRILGQDVGYVNRWWERETASAFGPACFMKDLDRVKIPVLHISGWWDGDGIGTKLNWAELRKRGHTRQWLVYGPWTHAFNSTSRVGKTDYGPDAILDLESIYVRWFDTWLKGKSVGQESQPRVRVFVTGANEWRDLADWPDPRSTVRTLYLSASAPANGAQGAGELVDLPPRRQDPDRYTYNPAHAVIPKELLERDPSSATTEVRLEAHDQDTLVYRTAPLTEPVEMGGPIEIDLHFSTSAVDTDFFADVMDIDAQGVMRAIGMGGKLRAKYRRSFDRPSLLKPGRVYKITLAHWDAAHRFQKGHRIGLLISSSGFPLYARNLNTGEPVATGTRMVAAHQTIHHDARHPSALRFRILPPVK